MTSPALMCLCLRCRKKSSTNLRLDRIHCNVGPSCVVLKDIPTILSVRIIGGEGPSLVYLSSVWCCWIEQLAVLLLDWAACHSESWGWGRRAFVAYCVRGQAAQMNLYYGTGSESEVFSSGSPIHPLLFPRNSPPLWCPSDLSKQSQGGVPAVVT
jgi:hypothetical protein